jgi:hypothetical protein
VSDEQPQRMGQQVLVPSPEWHDEGQRQAVLIATANAMQLVAARSGLEIVDVLDAEVAPLGLKANVGTVGGVSFVAYDPCPLDEADLVMITLSLPLVAKS